MMRNKIKEELKKIEEDYPPCHKCHPDLTINYNHQATMIFSVILTKKNLKNKESEKKEAKENLK